jgi:hypothetical protein
VSPSLHTLVLNATQDPDHSISHALVSFGIVGRVRVVAEDGYVLFEAWDHAPESPNYAWKVPIMPASAFWPKQRRSSRA